MIWVSPLDGNLTWYLHLKLPISTMFSFPVFIFQPHLSLDSGIGPEPGNKTKVQPMMASSAPKTAPTTPLGGGLHGYRKPHLSRAQSGGLSNGNGNGVPMPHATSVGLRRTQRYVQTFTILIIYHSPDQSIPNAGKNRLFGLCLVAFHVTSMNTKFFGIPALIWDLWLLFWILIPYCYSFLCF